VDPYDWVQISPVIGTDSLACHYLGVNYKVAFVTEKTSVKDALRIVLETMSGKLKIEKSSISAEMSLKFNEKK
jgi:hypothetical protein